MVLAKSRACSLYCIRALRACDSIADDNADRLNVEWALSLYSLSTHLSNADDHVGAEDARRKADVIRLTVSLG